MKNDKGIIFDFNGTLFWDTKYHEDAWNQMALKLVGKKLSDFELIHKMHGRTNKQILEYILNREITELESQSIADEKEKLYRSICLEQKGALKFADGVLEMLDELKSKRIPMTIATSSDKENVDFFIKEFQLQTWFDISKIVFNQGKYPGKPAPDIYLHALKNIQILPENCVVFEDAPSGILSAKNAGIDKIIQVKSNPIIREDTQNGVYKSISGFNEITIDELLNL